MRPGSVPFRRLCTACAALAAPTAIVLAALVMGGTLALSTATGAFVFVLAATAAIAYRHFAGLEALRRQIEGLAQDRPADPSAVRPHGQAADLAAALAKLYRKWVRRSEDLETAIAVNEAVLDSIPDPIILLDAQRRVTRANAAARDLFGPHIVAREIDAVLRDPGVLDGIDGMLAGQPAQAASMTIPGSVERQFDVRMAPLRPAGGEAALLLALYEVTAIRRAERMRADFVANVSHELRTPLSTLLGFTETLRGAARDDAAARDRFLGIMHEQASRMSRLVRDLLSLSKIEESEHTLPTGRIALGSLLNGVVDSLVLQARAKDIAVSVDIEPDIPVVVGDPDQIAQVFQNLIDNAIKYGRPTSTVRIAARRAQRPAGPPRPFVAVSIADEGEGIPREHLPRLTERFYRIDAGRSRQLGGTGLGLAIVKHIVNRHRGALTIDSEVGRGSVFTVYLPVAP